MALQSARFLCDRLLIDFWLACIFGGFAVGWLLAWSPLTSKGWQWLEEATALPRVGLLSTHRCSPPVRSHALWPNGKPWKTNKANLSKPTSRTICERELYPNRTEVPHSSSCVPLLGKRCHLCFAWTLSLETIPEEQPRSHTAADKHYCPWPSDPFSASREKLGPC